MKKIDGSDSDHVATNKITDRKNWGRGFSLNVLTMFTRFWPFLVFWTIVIGHYKTGAVGLQKIIKVPTNLYINKCGWQLGHVAACRSSCNWSKTFFFPEYKIKSPTIPPSAWKRYNITSDWLIFLFRYSISATWLVRGMHGRFRSWNSAFESLTMKEVVLFFFWHFFVGNPN